MPTFTFIRNRQVIETVVGANLQKLKSLIATQGASATATGGRVLGSGKSVSAQESRADSSWIFYGAVGLLIVYLYFNK